MYVITDNKSDVQNDLTLTENQSNLPSFRIVKITNPQKNKDISIINVVI